MNKIPIKTFYTYDVPDTKQLVKAMRGAMVISIILVIFSIIWSILTPDKILVSLCLIFISILLILAFRPLSAELEAKIKNETIVANDWGLEFYNTGSKVDIPWSKILMVAQKNKGVLFIRLKEYRLILKEEKKKTDLNSSMADKIREQEEHSLKASMPENLEDSDNFISFLSSLENVDFLVNYIEKNIKRIAEESMNVEMLNKPKSNDPLANILKNHR
jgi:hypothetical protein